MVQKQIPGSDWAENGAFHVLRSVSLWGEAERRTDTWGLRLQLLHTQDTGPHQASLCATGFPQEKVLPRAVLRHTVLGHNQLWRPPQPLADQGCAIAHRHGEGLSLVPHSDMEETSQVWLNADPAQ